MLFQQQHPHPHPPQQQSTIALLLLVQSYGPVSLETQNLHTPEVSYIFLAMSHNNACEVVSSPDPSLALARAREGSGVMSCLNCGKKHPTIFVQNLNVAKSVYSSVKFPVYITPHLSIV